MSQNLINTYVLMLSENFPSFHTRAGQPTNFNSLALEGLRNGTGKIHTIRGNYTLWRKRFEEISQGRAKLSLRRWSGRPYWSKQEFVADLTADNGIGLQRLDFIQHDKLKIDGHDFDNISQLAENDGLTLSDWAEMMSIYTPLEPLAIIHFTNFRY